MHEDLIKRLRNEPSDATSERLMHKAADALEAMQADMSRFKWLKPADETMDSWRARIDKNRSTTCTKT